ncbi:MAG: hypothetical protein HWD59_06815 [Coxiellaceae bacterium]|nr:MAG: hypothetical protein HWD59_06815 [Coxiellaceae bacterium]
MYKHILFAVEFDKGTDRNIEQIKRLVEICHPPKVSLIHVAEPLPYYIYPNLSQEEQDAQCIERATHQLTAVGKN